MATTSKRLLRVLMLAGALVLPAAAGAGPFDRKDNGGMDPNFTPAAIAKKNARIDAGIAASGSLAGKPRANGRVWGQVDSEADGTILLPGMNSDGAMISPPKSRDPGTQRLGVPNVNVSSRLGLDSVPRVGGHNTPSGGHTHNHPTPAPRVHTPSASSTQIHTPRH